MSDCKIVEGMTVRKIHEKDILIVGRVYNGIGILKNGEFVVGKLTAENYHDYEVIAMPAEDLINEDNKL